MARNATGNDRAVYLEIAQHWQTMALEAEGKSPLQATAPLQLAANQN